MNKMPGSRRAGLIFVGVTVIAVGYLLGFWWCQLAGLFPLIVGLTGWLPGGCKGDGNSCSMPKKQEPEQKKGCCGHDH